MTWIVAHPFLAVAIIIVVVLVAIAAWEDRHD